MNRKFTPRNQIKLSDGEVKRQSRVTKLALDRLGTSAAIAFLNSHRADVSGRPIQIAIASEEGLQSIEQLLAGSPVPAG